MSYLSEWLREILDSLADEEDEEDDDNQDFMPAKVVFDIRSNRYLEGLYRLKKIAENYKGDEK